MEPVPCLERVVGLQDAVCPAVTTHQKLVQIESGQALSTAPDLDVAKAASRRRAARFEQGLDHGG